MRLALALMLVASSAHAQSPAAGTPTTPLVARQTFEAAPVGGPWLNASVAHFRAVQPSTASGVTMLHGLYLESVLGSSLLPWAFYAELRTAHAIGAGVVSYARLRNEGPGWAAAFHTDVVASGSGPSIGVNVETSPMNTGTGRVIGVNVQSTADYAGEASTRATNEGINLQNQVGASFVDGIRFDAARVQTGLHFDAATRGTRAIWIEGLFTVGLDLGSSPLRMNAGTTIQLEGTGQITISYEPGRVVFKNGARTLGYLVIDGTATGGRLN